MRRFKSSSPCTALPFRLWSDLRSFSAQTPSFQRLGVSCPYAEAIPGVERSEWKKSSRLAPHHLPPIFAPFRSFLFLFRKTLPLFDKLTIPSQNMWITCVDNLC